MLRLCFNMLEVKAKCHCAPALKPNLQSIKSTSHQMELRFPIFICKVVISSQTLKSETMHVTLQQCLFLACSFRSGTHPSSLARIIWKKFDNCELCRHPPYMFARPRQWALGKCSSSNDFCSSGSMIIGPCCPRNC